MKISNKILSLLNEQIAIEADASSYYLSVSSWCKITGFDGAAGFFRAQSDDEREHMIKIIEYLNELKVHAEIPVIQKQLLHERNSVHLT